MAAAPLKLHDDEIDELLYLARANETDDLPAYLAEVQKLPQYEGASAADILCAAVDAHSGNSVLHYAAANGHSAVIDVIKKTLTSAYAASSSDAYKPFVNLRNSSGNTALHWAALNGHLDAVKLLVSLGADAAVLNAAGHDAVYEAEQNDKNDVVSWLLVEGGALDTVVGALKEQEAAEGNKEDDGEDVEMKMTMGDTSEGGDSGVEKGIEGLSVDDSAKGKERAS